MNPFKCPACGAPLFEDKAMCSSCKSDIDWQHGQPAISTAGEAFKRVVIVTLVAVVAAALVLTAILIVVPKI